MKETSKCHQIRLSRGDYEKFLHGNGIDIGAGDDPLRPPAGTARSWDKEDGDAQLMPGVPDGQLDFVYSSHCLEHMRSVPEALKNWGRILKPNGWLYFVVPDYLLYEKMTWPSRFNQDHKQSFSTFIPRSAVVRPNHWHMEQDMMPLLKDLGFSQTTYTLESYNFNFNAGMFDQTMHDILAQLCVTAQKI